MAKTPNVAFKRKELEKQLPEYEVISDAMAGSMQVKRRKTKYLPNPSGLPLMGDPDAIARYNSYLTRAVFYGVTGRTVKGMVGQIFLRDPVIELPAQLQIVAEDTNGEGVSAIQLAKRVATWVLPLGRSGLLVDYPETNGEATTRAQLEEGGIRPTIRAYEPQHIINWRTIGKGATQVLSLVVLEELYTKKDDGFELEQETQWRVLRLDVEGRYVVEIWRKHSESNYYRVKTTMPLNGSGQPFAEIPFTFIGSENNDSEVDAPPLFDLADLNIAHYRNSADYEELTFLIGQPTPVITGLTEAWVDKYFSKGIALGSRTPISLPANADAKLLQPEESTLSFQAMEHKERQMVALGAKLVEQKTVQRTAKEAGLEEAAESSTLATVANNISAAFRQAFVWAAEFLNVTATAETVKFELNTDFELAKMSADERRAVIEEWTKGAITFGEMRAVLRKGGIATLDDDAAQSQLATEGLPPAVQLDGNNDDGGNTPPDDDE